MAKLNKLALNPQDRHQFQDPQSLPSQPDIDPFKDTFQGNMNNGTGSPQPPATMAVEARSHSQPIPLPRSPSALSTSYSKSDDANSMTTMTSQINTVRHDLSRLDQSLAALEKAGFEKIRRLEGELESLKYICNMKDAEHTTEVDRLKSENMDLRNTIDFVEKNNNKLRGDIAEMGNDLNPAYDEDHYINGFEQIKVKIEMWVASHTLPQGSVSKDVVKKVWQDLTNNGLVWSVPTGPLVDNNVFRVWYADDTARLQLVRHFISAFLFVYVFQPYIFGMDQGGSELFRLVGEDIIQNCTSQIEKSLTCSYSTIFTEIDNSSSPRSQRNSQIRTKFSSDKSQFNHQSFPTYLLFTSSYFQRGDGQNCSQIDHCCCRSEN